MRPRILYSTVAATNYLTGGMNLTVKIWPTVQGGRCAFTLFVAGKDKSEDQGDVFHLVHPAPGGGGARRRRARAGGLGRRAHARGARDRDREAPSGAPGRPTPDRAARSAHLGAEVRPLDGAERGDARGHPRASRRGAICEKTRARFGSTVSPTGSARGLLRRARASRSTTSSSATGISHRTSSATDIPPLQAAPDCSA